MGASGKELYFPIIRQKRGDNLHEHKKRTAFPIPEKIVRPPCGIPAPRDMIGLPDERKAVDYLYLSAFYFPGEEEESDFMFGLKTTYDQTVYPYGILPKAGLNEIIFRPLTILYGGNGS